MKTALEHKRRPRCGAGSVSVISSGSNKGLLVMMCLMKCGELSTKGSFAIGFIRGGGRFAAASSISIPDRPCAVSYPRFIRYIITIRPSVAATSYH